jgi:hypothetical protein
VLNQPKKGLLVVQWGEVESRSRWPFTDLSAWTPRPFSLLGTQVQCGHRGSLVLSHRQGSAGPD